MKPSLLFLIIALQMPGASAAPPQEPAAGKPPRLISLIERAEVRVLLLDVVVTDKKGNPILDLKQEDFRLTIDRRPALIDSFEFRFPASITDSSLPVQNGDQEEVVSPEGGPDRRIIVFFDAQNSRALDQQRAREETMKFLKRFIVPSDHVMVLSYSQARLRVIQPFTSRREEWSAAVQELIRDQGYLETYMDGETRRMDQVYDACLDAGREKGISGSIARRKSPFPSGAVDSAGGSSSGGGGRGMKKQPGETAGRGQPGPGNNPFTSGQGTADSRQDLNEYCGAAWSIADEYIREEMRSARRTLATLRAVVQAMRGLPGKKSILYLSEGVRPVPGEEYFAAASCRACADSKLKSTLALQQVGKDFKELFRQANDSNVAVHVLDTKRFGVLSPRPARYQPGDPTSRPEARFDFLTNLAFQTGGMRGAAAAGLDKNFEKLGVQMNTYYTLGHTLPGEGPDSRAHAIRIEVDRPGAVLHYRKSFRDLGWREKEESTLMGAVVLPEPYQEISLKARVLAVRKDWKRFEAFFEMGIPFSDIYWVPTQFGELGGVEFVGEITDEWGAVKHRFRDRMELKRGTAPAGAGGRGIYYRGQVELKPGTYELRAVAHDFGGGKMGGARVSFEIPDTHGKSLTLHGPILGKISRGDMVIGVAPPSSNRRGLPKKYRRETVVPLLEEELTTRDLLVTYLQIYDPAKRVDSSHRSLMVKVEFLKNGEVMAAHQSVRVEEDAVPRPVSPFAILTPMRKLQPGDYQLRVEVVDEDTGRKVEKMVPIRVLPPKIAAKIPTNPEKSLANPESDTP